MAINGAYYATWAGRTDLTPSFVNWVENNGTVFGEMPVIIHPTISRLYDSYYFTVPNLYNDIFAKIDSGDTSMTPVERYRYFIIRPTDATRTVVQPPTGAYVVSFLLLDATDMLHPVPLPDCKIRVYVAGDPSPRRTLTNRDNGTTEPVALDGIEYTIVVERAGYTFSPYITTITANWQITIAGEANVIIVPPSPIGAQTLYSGDVHGTPTMAAGGCVITAVPESNQAVSGSGLTRREIKTVSSDTGFWSLSLWKGMQYTITEVYQGTIFRANKITITDDDTKNYITYLQ